jgi:hypothetical protein
MGCTEARTISTREFPVEPASLPLFGPLVRNTSLSRYQMRTRSSVGLYNASVSVTSKAS